MQYLPSQQATHRIELIFRNIFEYCYSKNGYEIAKALQEGNDGKQGTIYPVLRNLHNKGLLDCEVKLSESGPPRKYFSISALGIKVLEQWTQTWRATQAQVNSILG
ncbi:MAG: hypothetical protein GJ680_01495 [Alteromonadaceae bacterium]|nr:hypothetical protein [Alteromonadaceae bacterium]